jgi:hypothetical protein
MKLPCNPHVIGIICPEDAKFLIQDKPHSTYFVCLNHIRDVIELISSSEGPKYCMVYKIPFIQS